MAKSSSLVCFVPSPLCHVDACDWEGNACQFFVFFPILFLVPCNDLIMEFHHYTTSILLAVFWIHWAFHKSNWFKLNSVTETRSITMENANLSQDIYYAAQGRSCNDWNLNVSHKSCSKRASVNKMRGVVVFITFGASP